jgi:uncharacterized membrane protein YfcA
MTFVLAVVAVVAGVLLGLSLGALGGGGSILAVPVLVHLLGQSPAQATTGSLVVVGVTALVSAVVARRHGVVLLARGVAFGVVSIGGAAAGAQLSAHASETALLATFAVLMLVVGGLSALRQLRDHRGRSSSQEHPPEDAVVRARLPQTSAAGHSTGAPAVERGPALPRRAMLDDPIVTFRPTFFCQCPRALKVLVAATAVGLLTGFLGVGGGFLVVPALVVAMALPMEYATGTSLVVITVTSASALAVRAGIGIAPDWGVVVILTAASLVGGLIGTRIAARTDTARLSAAFTVLVLGIAVYTAALTLPALV